MTSLCLIASITINVYACVFVILNVVVLGIIYKTT